jgi:hypothetical protein
MVPARAQMAARDPLNGFAAAARRYRDPSAGGSDHRDIWNDPHGPDPGNHAESAIAGLQERVTWELVLQWNQESRECDVSATSTIIIAARGLRPPGG